jgi:hypothetical protein
MSPDHMSGPKWSMDDVALTVVASCISRGEHLTLDIDTSKSRGVTVCDRCDAPTALLYGVRGISTEAVYDIGTIAVCAACDVQGKPE